MVKVSYSDLFGIRHERDHDEEIHVGDQVRTGANANPKFTVMALHDGKAWLRSLDNGSDGVVALNRCRKTA
jgi:hypothetical protein